MLYVLFSLASAFLFALVGIFQKSLPEKSKDTRLFALWFLVFASLIAVGFWIVKGAPQNYTLSIFLFLALLCYIIWNRYRFEIAVRIEASSMILLSVMVVLIPVLGGLILLGERLSKTNLLGLALTLFSVFLLGTSFFKKKGIRLKDFFIAFLLNTILGLGALMDKLNLRIYPFPFYNLLVWSLPIVGLLPPKINLSALQKELKETGKEALILALVQSTAYLLALMALTRAPISKVSPLVNLSLIMGTLLSLVVFREKENVPLKITASFLAFAGAYLISV